MEGKILSHFRILDRLGEGGMGIVYRAEDTNLRRQVALKLLRPGFVEDEERRVRFKREARTAAAVSHPNIATIHEIDDAEGTTFIAMELIEGDSLRHRLAHGPLPIPEAIRVACDVSSALTKAHEAGVIHRDLKPDNVMITDDGHVKILDFGLAKLLDPAPSSDQELEAMETMAQHLTREGRVFGTAAYMSPEQARGHTVDTRSDLFSFGAMLYEMVTGHAPFKGESISDTISSVLRDPVIPAIEVNPQLPPELDRILGRLLQKRANERYQSSRDLMLELKQLARATDGTSYTTELTPPAGHVSQSTQYQTPSTPVPSYGSGSGSYGAASTPSGRVPSGSGAVPAAKTGPWRVVLLAGIPIVAILVIGVVASVVRPLVAGRQSPSPPSIPAAPAPESGALAIHTLENLKDPDDPERLGQILQELIITDLSSVQPLRVFSSQRLYDVQKRLTGRDDRVYDRETATEVAQYAGAELMLTGTISQLGERWILLSQLVDVERGTITSSERIDGTDLYAMVDQLTDRIRGRLDLTAARGNGTDKDVREMTTASIEAYRYYLRGVELLNEQAFGEAVAVLDSAIALDPTFSRAYYSLAVAHWWANDGAEISKEPLAKLLSGDLEITEKERRMAEGASLLVERRYADALPVFERLVAAYPDEKDVWYMLGECYYHSPNPQRMRALSAFVRSVKLDPEFFLGYRHIFDIYDANAMSDEALALARVLVDLDPEDQEHYGRWVEYTAIAGDEAALAAAIEEATTRFADTLGRAELMVSVGRALLGRGRFEEARKAFDEAGVSDDTDVAVSVALGLAAIDLALLDYASAERRLEVALETSSPQMKTVVLQRLAELYFQQGRHDEGLALAESFAEATGDSTWSLFAAAGFGALRTDAPTEEEVAKITESMSPSMSSDLFDLMALACQQCGDFEGAERYLAALDSLKTEPNGDDFVQRAESAIAIGDLGAAELILNRALAMNPGDAQYLLALADVALLRDTPDEAISLAERAIELAPQGRRSHRMRVRALLRSGRLAEADAALQAARETLPPRLVAWMLVGSRGAISRALVFEYARAGHMARARELLAEARAGLPDDPDVSHAEGWLALKSGDLTSAERAFRRGLAVSYVPSFDSSRMGSSLAVARLLSGDAAGAERLLRAGIDAGPHHARLYRLTAYVLEELGRAEEAVGFAQRALGMDPGPESHAAMAWVLVAGGIDVARGEQLAEMADEGDASWELPFTLAFVAPASHTLGLAALRQGRLAEAVERLEASAAAHPERATIRAHLEESRTALREAQG